MEEARYEAVKRASEYKTVNDFFPISDMRFTIYKEMRGQEMVYVTRFTSLRDGKVTVTPEPELMPMRERASGALLDGII